MQKYTLDFAIHALNEAGWKTIPSIEPWIIILVETSQESHYLSLCFYRNAAILFVKGLVVTAVEEKHENILMEFIQTGNRLLSISNFEYDVQNKELNCRSGIYFNDIELSTQLIHNLVYEVYDNVIQYKPLVKALFSQQITVPQIFTDNK